MNNENSAFERQKEVIKFYQEYIEPMNIRFFDHMKYLIVFVLGINGTPLIVLFSIQKVEYYPAMSYFVYNVFFTFLLLFLYLMFRFTLSDFLKLKSTQKFNEIDYSVEYYNNYTKWIYLLLFVFLLAEFITFAFAIEKIQRVFLL